MDIFNTSHIRGNITAWLPVQKEEQILYIGSPEEIAAKRLAEKTDSLVCRMPEELSGSMKDEPEAQTYDQIICVGRLHELADRFRETGTRAGAHPEDSLYGEKKAVEKLSGLLKTDGKLILAVENIFGLKYFAGTREEGSGEYFGGLNQEAASSGYTREEVLRVLQETGLYTGHCYYPFPDYRFTMSLYSDVQLPKVGELIDQTGNFGQDRLILFDETKAVNVVIEKGRFREFANSYLLVAGKQKKTTVCNEKGEEIVFVKFSNDRAENRNIRTCITVGEENDRHVYKLADQPQALPQITGMEEACRNLNTQFEATKFQVNRYLACPGGAEFEFLQGTTMEEIVDRLLEQGRMDEAREQILAVCRELAAGSGQKPFERTEAFEEVFGTCTLPEGLMAYEVTDIDMILPNILISREAEQEIWNVIDYEWFFTFPVPVHYILYRCIHYYAETTAVRRELGAEELYQRAGLSKKEVTAYDRMERSFQAWMCGGHLSLAELDRDYGKEQWHITSLIYARDHWIERRKRMRIYYDRGNGTREEDSFSLGSESLDGQFKLEVPLDDDVKEVRIDPAEQACTVEIRKLKFLSSEEDIVPFGGTVHQIEGNLYLLTGDDPFLNLAVPEHERTLQIDMRVEIMSVEAAKILSEKISPKYWLKKLLKK